MVNMPLPLEQADIEEIAEFSDVRQMWGAETVKEMEEMLKNNIYGVKFKYTSGSPGYCGDVVLLLGDSLPPPVMLVRNESRKLSIAHNF